MRVPERITPEETQKRLKANEALLVCAYGDEETFKRVQLEGAISLREFYSKLPVLPKTQEIVFYCA